MAPLGECHSLPVIGPLCVRWFETVNRRNILTEYSSNLVTSDLKPVFLLAESPVLSNGCNATRVGI